MKTSTKIKNKKERLEKIKEAKTKLLGSFAWDATRQGFEYWNKVYKQLFLVESDTQKEVSKLEKEFLGEGFEYDLESAKQKLCTVCLKPLTVKRKDSEYRDNQIEFYLHCKPCGKNKTAWCEK